MEVTAPETEASKRGIKDPKVRSKLNISMVKIMAAIGALKMDAIAAAEAQDINTILDLKLICINLPRLEPMAEPVLTDGPSNPTEPPKPTVKILVAKDPNIL